MIRLNLRPGDRVRVGDTVFRYAGKENGRSRFEVAYSGGGVARRQDAGIGASVTLGPNAFFVVEKRSGRSSRIALQALPTIPVARVVDPPIGVVQAVHNYPLRCQGKTR